MTDIFKSADWAREAEKKRAASAAPPIYMDQHGVLWTISLHGSERVRLPGGLAPLADETAPNAPFEWIGEKDVSK